MVWPEWATAVAPQALAIVAMVALAGVLLYLDFNNRANRAFSLFLTLRALSMTSATLRELAIYTWRDPGASAYWGGVFPYFTIPIPFVLLYFLLVYPRPRWGTHANRYIFWTLVAVALAAEAAYALNHAWWQTFSFDGLGRWAPTRIGPLQLLLGLMYVSYGVVAYALSRQIDDVPAGARRRAFVVVTLGFALNGLFDASLSAFALANGTGPTLVIVMSAGALVFYGLLVGRLVRYYRGPDKDLAQSARRFLLWLPWPVLTAMAAFRTEFGQIFFIATGIWRLAFPVFVSYALVRHQLFDIDVKIQRTVRRGLMVSPFAVAFFVGGETLESLLPFDSFVLGLAGAAAVTVALHPIQRAADRIAHTLIPGARPLSNLGTDERVAFYEEQVALALMDGSLREKERNLLDNLRQRLGIPDHEAQRAERRVAARPAVAG